MEMLEAAITTNVVRHQKIPQLTLTRALTLRMKERIVGGVVDERKESVLGVEKMECAVEEDGQETVVTGKLEDPATISAQRHRKIQELTLRRVLAYKIKEKIAGGAVDEEKENALGVETECAVEKVGLETVAMELLVDDVITNVSPNQKAIWLRQNPHAMMRTTQDFARILSSGLVIIVIIFKQTVKNFADNVKIIIY